MTGTLRRYWHWGAAVGLLVALEGVSFGQTPIPVPCVHVDASEPGNPSTNPSAFEGAAARTARGPDAQPNPFFVEGVLLDGNGESLFARARLCHISHHPRGNLRADELSCPLLFADATIPSSVVPVE
jgi:hypothetical protein